MKKVTKTAPVEKVEPCTDSPAPHHSLKKVYLHHKAYDHSYGRVNKTPFGINHEPGCF